MVPAMNASIITAPTASSETGGAEQPSILDAITTLSEDPIPNIRFNVAKAFEVVATVLASADNGADMVKERILPGLTKLKSDPDADVRYFAGKALEVRAYQGGLGCHC